VHVLVQGPVSTITVSPDAAEVPVGASQTFSATARDALGHELKPQPRIAWSVSGGGKINGAGIFVAKEAGGPFNLTAKASGITSSAQLTVVPPREIVGNTNDGFQIDTLWNNGSWINAIRVQPNISGNISTLHAKLKAIQGHYKAAIYSDASGQPKALLGSTAEISPTNDRWQSLLLASSLPVTKNVFYWLAIWSDDPGAGIFYSDNQGHLAWGRYDYGSWPDSLAFTESANLNYCLYADSPSGS
jgi:hypothetical protein